MKQYLARFHFELRDGSPLAITYQLQPNSLVPRWIDIVTKRQADQLELKISNKGIEDLPYLMDTLNEIVKTINSYYDRQLPLFTSINEINRDTLNHLHEEFEVYGTRHQAVYPQGIAPVIPADADPTVWPGTEFKMEFHQTWMKLNEYIHITESAMDNSGWPNYSCLVQYMPFEWGVAVTETDKIFLDNNFKWGQLYLGYNTLGKDWNDACMDNDQRLISNDQIKVQQSFCSESWLNFNAEAEMPKSAEAKFYQWWQSLSPGLQQLVPIDSINKLALGRYYLGQVVLDEAFLDFHPVHDDWLLPNSELRSRWNKEVFGKIVKAAGIEVQAV